MKREWTDGARLCKWVRKDTPVHRMYAHAVHSSVGSRLFARVREFGGIRNACCPFRVTANTSKGERETVAGRGRLPFVHLPVSPYFTSPPHRIASHRIGCRRLQRPSSRPPPIAASGFVEAQRRGVDTDTPAAGLLPALPDLISTHTLTRPAPPGPEPIRFVGGAAHDERC